MYYNIPSLNGRNFHLECTVHQVSIRMFSLNKKESGFLHALFLISSLFSCKCMSILIIIVSSMPFKYSQKVIVAKSPGLAGIILSLS